MGKKGNNIKARPERKQIWISEEFHTILSDYAEANGRILEHFSNEVIEAGLRIKRLLPQKEGQEQDKPEENLKQLLGKL